MYKALQSPEMDEAIGKEVLNTLRKISRAIELYSRVLYREYGLTGPQLTILKAIYMTGSLTVSEIAHTVSLSQATVTDILLRLEKQGYIIRCKRDTDRRRVYIEITETAKKLLEKNPSSLHSSFLKRFQHLESWEKTLLLSSLQRIALLMDLETLEEEKDPPKKKGSNGDLSLY
jgi:DNA-binding MarR family transcriptional regulator